jgi:hypothetical protein
MWQAVLVGLAVGMIFILGVGVGGILAAGKTADRQSASHASRTGGEHGQV